MYFCGPVSPCYSEYFEESAIIQVTCTDSWRMIRKYFFNQQINSITCFIGEDNHGWNYDSSLGSSPFGSCTDWIRHLPEKDKGKLTRLYVRK